MERAARLPRSSGRPSRSMRAARLRPEVFCEEMPAPQRIAPYASALSADVTVDGDDVGTGRLVLLHDPAGNDAWEGTFRCVAYARAEIDPEMVTDPLLAEVGWSWLTEALDAHGATYVAPSGTVTRVVLGELRRHGRRGRHRPARDPGLLDAGRRPDGDGARPRPARRGVGRAAVHRRRACRRSPRASPRCRAAADSAAEADAAARRPDPPTTSTTRPARPAARPPRRPSRAPLLELRDGLPPVVDTADGAGRGASRPFAGRHRPGRDRRRARVGLPLLRRAPTCPAAPRGLGHGAGRPDRLRRPRPRSHEALGDAEWILHAASQDLACLAEVGLRPTALFDTELAGRLLGYPRVGLATLVEAVARLSDCARSTPPSTGRPGRCPSPGWSTPPSTSRCSSSCARRSARELEEAGKAEWARQEFEHLRRRDARRPAAGPVAAYLGHAPGPRPPRPRPPYASCGRPATRSPQQPRRHPGPDHPRLRDRRGRQRDAPRPGRRCSGTKGFHGRGAERYARPLGRGAARGPQPCPTTTCRRVAARYDGPPPPRAWADRDPVAAARLATRPGGAQGPRRGAPAAGGEPAHPRLRPPA